jgi:hypothetical protein
MASVWLQSALWLGLALLASLISIRIAVSVALIEIVVGAVAGNLIGLQLTDWVQFSFRLRRDSVDLSRWRGNRSAHREKALLVKHVDRARGLRRALPRSAALRAFRRRLAVASRADLHCRPPR